MPQLEKHVIKERAALLRQKGEQRLDRFLALETDSAYSDEARHLLLPAGKTRSGWWTELRAELLMRTAERSSTVA